MPVAPVAGGGSSNGNGVAFLVAAGIVYEIIAAACSSPQTTEINADVRADTLMKWVHIGLVQSAAFIAIAVLIDPEDTVPILAGGGLAAGLMYGSYWHAKKAGLESSEPGTEQYASDTAPWMMKKSD
jgi:hypothetical protein